ncbi:MAG: hypothetical protein ACOCXZ_03505 [Chloroflexota bacterium]
MNILGMGLWELVLVLVIALVVAGPKRTLNWMYVLGRFAAQVREMWSRVMEGVQKDLDDAGVDIKLPADPTDRAEMSRFARDALRPLQEPMQKAMRDYENEARQLEKTIKDEAHLEIDKVEGVVAEARQSVMDKPAAPLAASGAAAANGQGREAPASAQQNDPAEDTTSASAKPAKRRDFGTWSSGGTKG